uniref:Somatostatin receptor 4 n=1 Tax=Malurus cyaneus samueli TaxID=2593467 RepID=A0A8C5UC09_9PASS
FSHPCALPAGRVHPAPSRPMRPAARGGEIADGVARSSLYRLVCLLGLWANRRPPTADAQRPFAARRRRCGAGPSAGALPDRCWAWTASTCSVQRLLLAVLSWTATSPWCTPLRAASYRRPRVAKLVNGAVWLLALLAASPIPVFAGTAVTPRRPAVACDHAVPGGRPSWVQITACGFAAVAAMALCMLLAAKMRAVARGVGWRQRRRSEGKLTRLVVTVVAAFVVCWLPFYVVQLLSLLLPGRLDASAHNASLLLSYSNSCANPILYGLLSENFRHPFHGVLRRCRHSGLCCCRAGDGDGGDDEDEEEPLDYCAAPRGDGKGCVCPPLPCPQDPLRPQPCCAPRGPSSQNHPF